MAASRAQGTASQIYEPVSSMTIKADAVTGISGLVGVGTGPANPRPGADPVVQLLHGAVQPAAGCDGLHHQFGSPRRQCSANRWAGPSPRRQHHRLGFIRGAMRCSRPRAGPEPDVRSYPQVRRWAVAKA